jgi:PAS domain S-box-containing protein
MFRTRPENAAPLKDFFTIYDGNYSEITARTLEAAALIPEFAPILAKMSPEELERENREGRVRLKRALVDGEWGPYEADLRAQGTAYARLGVSYHAWYELVGAFQRFLTPLIVKAQIAEPDRLSLTLTVMQEFVDWMMAAIAEQYLETKEASLSKTQERYRRLFDKSPLPKWVYDRETHRFLDVNDAAVASYGWSRDEFLAMTVKDIRPPEDVAAFLSDVGSSSARGPTAFRHRKKDGTVIHVEVSSQDFDMDGRPARLVVANDVTERRRVEAVRQRTFELEAENRRVQEGSRLKSEFLANMSHELRTPLNAIIGFAELLHDGQVGAVSEKQAEFLGDILNSGKHLLQLINDVLDLAKVEAGKLEFRPESVDLAKVVAEVTAVLRANAAAKEIRVGVEIDPSVTDVVIDAGRLKQVLYNYLSNALKFTPQGKAVSIRISPAGPEMFRLEVEDEGHGIEAKDLAKLFVEFQQIDGGTGKRHGGTGLGLALTRRMVEAQKGSVGVKSTPGQGSTFHAVLPRRSSVAAAIPLARAGGSILVVEDDPGDQKILAETLEAAGYSVEIAPSGARALELARARHFQAITLDLLLPDMSGLEVLSAIRNGSPNVETPVLVVTIVSETRVIAGFAVHDVIPKPLDGARLVESLSRAGVKPDRDGTILVVDDDPGSLKLMDTSLTQVGYRTDCRNDALAALDVAAVKAPLAVVLDLMMPGVDGFGFLKRFRELPSCRSVPVLVWTMKDLTREERERLGRSAQAVVGKDGGVASLLDELDVQLKRRGADA